MRRSRESRVLTARPRPRSATDTACRSAFRRETKRPPSAASSNGAPSLVEQLPLVDEIVVMDDGSTDATGDAACAEGAVVFSVADLLP